MTVQCRMTAEFQQGGKIIKAHHSSPHGDKFQELLNEFFIIYNAGKTGAPYAFELKWNDDRADYLWSVSKDTDIEVEITELSPTGESYKEQLIKHTFSFEELFNTIYISLSEMLKAFGFIGYKTNWEAGNFPIYEYLILKSENYNLELQKVNFADVSDDQEDPYWRRKVSPADELRLITL
ncbi:hypothetical protein [Chitinophaga sp.]|uniref:hypothetical protein n=1 Tax=Chitinophaga sp. TaxID=1869181 RepID=UPI0031DEE731